MESRSATASGRSIGRATWAMAVGGLALALLALALAGCRPPAERGADDASGEGVASRAGDAVRVEVRVLDTAPQVGPATVEVEVARDSRGVDGASVTVTGDMTHAGMVPVVERAEPLGSGRYRTTGFRFTMAGDWVLTVDVTLPDGQRHQRAAPVTVSAGAHAP